MDGPEEGRRLSGRPARVGLLMSCLATLAFVVVALTRLGWEVEFCHACGNRFETAELGGLRLGSFHYQTRLGSWLADQDVCVDCCPHRQRHFVRKGGWELFLAEHWLFSDRND